MEDLIIKSCGLNTLLSVDIPAPPIEKIINPISESLERNGLTEIFLIVLVLAVAVAVIIRSIIIKKRKQKEKFDLEENFSKKEFEE